MGCFLEFLCKAFFLNTFPFFFKKKNRCRGRRNKVELFWDLPLMIPNQKPSCYFFFLGKFLLWQTSLQGLCGSGKFLTKFCPNFLSNPV